MVGTSGEMLLLGWEPCIIRNQIVEKEIIRNGTSLPRPNKLITPLTTAKRGVVATYVDRRGLPPACHWPDMSSECQKSSTKAFPHQIALQRPVKEGGHDITTTTVIHSLITAQSFAYCIAD